MNVTSSRPSLRQAIDRKCRSCIYDPLARGAWREQVAACCSANCDLFEARPVPRDCVAAGVIDQSAIAVVREKLSKPAAQVIGLQIITAHGQRAAAEG